MNFLHLLSSGANSSFSRGQLGTHKRQCTSPCREGSKNTSEHMLLHEDFKRRLLTYSNGQLKGINDLPPEIIIDIFSRLPLESILASTLVCWRWYRVTRDPDFIKLQLSRSEPRLILQPLLESVNHLGLVDIEGEGRNTWQIPIIKTLWNDFKIMCSYNGLLCMARRDTKADPLYIYNPITRGYMVLPNSGSRRVLSNYVVCLGSASTGWYKIVRHYRQKLGSKESRFEILSLGHGSWREVNVSLLDWDACRARFHNGVFFITMMRKVPKQYWNMCIIAIDVSDEKIQIIPFQEKLFLHPFLELLEVKGRLNIIEHVRDVKHIWVLTGNKVGEFSLHHQDIFCTSRKRRERCYHEIICKLKGDKFLMQQTWDHHFVLFCPEKVKYADYFFDRIPRNLEFKVFHFKPSFVSPIAAALLC